jgi:hypothetical protein
MAWYKPLETSFECGNCGKETLKKDENFWFLFSVCPECYKLPPVTIHTNENKPLKPKACKPERKLPNTTKQRRN